MALSLFSLLTLAGAMFAGMLGALTGLGGGVILIPLLTLVFKVDIRYAIGAALVSVIATSSGAAAAYVRDGYSNVRIGMFLEVATTIGAVSGAWLASRVPTRGLAILFGVVMLYSAYLSWQKFIDPETTVPNRWAEKLKLGGTFPDHGKLRRYSARRIIPGFLLMLVAGVLSGLLGIGSGAVKVLAMDRVMAIPFKVSTTTSNFMIGVTAAASAGIYLHRGYVNPGLDFPVMLGVLAGSMLGAKILIHAHVSQLRIVFALVIFALGAEMIIHGWLGAL